MANENPAAPVDSAATKPAAAKKSAPKKAGEPKKATAPKKSAQPKPKPAADAPAPPAASAAGEQVTQVAAAKAAEPTPLEVGQKVRWYHNGSEDLPQNNYEAHITELPNANGIASLVVSIEGVVENRSAAQQVPGNTVQANTAFFIAE